MKTLLLFIGTGIMIGFIIFVPWEKYILETKKNYSIDNSKIESTLDTKLNYTIDYTMDKTIFMVSKLTNEEREILFKKIKAKHPEWK